MFCRRSQVERHLEAIHSTAAQSDIFVLNGDIFDFRWSQFDSTEETVREAIRWLEALTNAHSHCHFYYVLGNHDHVQKFIDALEAFTKRTPNLSWRPYYLKLHTTLFLHGDVSIRRMTARDHERYRESWLHEECKGEFVNKVFDVAFKAGVHRAIGKFAFPRSAVLERIQHYLDDIGQGRASDTEHVYFGHTHSALLDFEFGGQRFFNAGAPMPGLNFNVLTTKVPA